MADETPMTVDEIFADSKTRLQALAPYLIGLDMLDQNTVLKKDEVQHVFDTLLQIGVDQVSGQGIFADKELHHEVPYFALLQNPAVARAFRGVGDLDMLAEGVNSTDLRALSEKIDSLAEPGPKGPLFSIAAKAKADAILSTKAKGKGRAREYRNIGEELVAILGDRPVDAYTAVDLSKYATEISYLPAKASRQKGFKYKSVCKWIDENRDLHVKGLSYKTIHDRRLSMIKAIIAMGCDDAGVKNPVANRRIKVPDWAAAPVKHDAPDGAMFERIWRPGIESGILADALLPPLAFLTGRRVGLLAMLRREDFYELHGVLFFVVRSHDFRNGKWEPLPIKTLSSMEKVILPSIPELQGFVDWVRKEPGPVFAKLMECSDPADSAQKRVNRLIQDHTPDGEMKWQFRNLRDGKIDNDRDNDVDGRLIRSTVGHERLDTHESYGARLTPKQMIKIATSPVPEGVDWGLLNTIDFEAFAAARQLRKRPKK